MKTVMALAFLACPIFAVVVGTVRGVVHDPDHRPVQRAQVHLKSSDSDYFRDAQTDQDGGFEISGVPTGSYVLSLKAEGLAPIEQSVVVSAGSSPQLHFQMAIGARTDRVTVSESAQEVAGQQVTPSTVVTRSEIANAPGADLSNSLAMITDFVPGAYMAHDQLHVRGGHQVSWAIDGVPIPNTNIASNVGPQIDPKDVDYLEAQRGGYSAAYGDRTYGVFNVVPRTGFERNREAELFTTFGTFHQTNDQINFGDHSEKLAYFVSANGNRSDYGLETPGPEALHDRVWGGGGMASLIYNRSAEDQFRIVASARSDDYEIPGSPDNITGDVERERDELATFTWVRTLRKGVLLTVSPFYHHNQANYDGDPSTTPVSTTQHRGSQYFGAQIAVNANSTKHNASAGVYTFGQHDDEFVHLVSDDGAVLQDKTTTGGLEAVFLEDEYKAFSWLTLRAGVRVTHFSGTVSETAASPRLGGSIRIPHLNWVLRGFWGKYYQAPPLSTVSGPLLDFAVAQGLGVIPLHGERDQEHQFGLTIPFHGWSFDVNNYHQRAQNYFDHNAIGNSNVFFPLTIAGARLMGWEVSIRSPRIAHRGEVSLSYADALAEGSGTITGGLTDFSPPPEGYFWLDHDQRHTLHAGLNWTLPWRVSASGNIYYGSGFVDGQADTPRHLEPHMTFDASLSKPIGERLIIAVTALNAGNRRFLLDNSQTFGGTHYADPRQIYLQVRYRFKL